MSRWFSEGWSAGRRRGPVLDPVRVMVVDLDVASRVALARAVDLDPALAIVSLCGDPRRAVRDAGHATPDLVVVRLELEDERCQKLLEAFAADSLSVCVIVAGAPGQQAAADRDAWRLAARIKTLLGAPDVPSEPPAMATPFPSRLLN